MKSSKNLFKGIGALAISGLFLIGCGDDPVKTDPSKTTTVDTTKAENVKKDPPVQKFDNAMFSIPSPIQLGQIIQKSGAKYNEDLLNKPASVSTYSEVSIQALNLGVYGADLGYTALYEKNQESIKFMKAVQQLSTEVGIADAFDMETINAVQRNLDSGNKDSLLYVISNSYRKADDFLQNSGRKYIGALVVVGGWVESMHFACQLGKQDKSPEIQNMVGMQQHTLNTILDKMLFTYSNDPGIEDVAADLETIRGLFDQVEIKYEYVKPETNKETKTTKLKSKSSVTISDELFGQIAEKIEEIRTKFIK